jgi:hypothetical protein
MHGRSRATPNPPIYLIDAPAQFSHFGREFIGAEAVGHHFVSS